MVQAEKKDKKNRPGDKNVENQHYEETPQRTAPYVVRRGEKERNRAFVLNRRRTSASRAKLSVVNKVHQRISSVECSISSFGVVAGLLTPVLTKCGKLASRIPSLLCTVLFIVKLN